MTYTFTHEDLGFTTELDQDKIVTLRNTLGISYDDLADLLTGYNCDTYADATEELANDSEGDVNEARDIDEDTYDRVRAYHRILNGNLSDDQCEESWLEAFQATAN